MRKNPLTFCRGCVLVPFVNAPAANNLADRFAITLEGMRAAMALEGVRKTPAGVLQAAILRLLEAILALLVQFEAGTLAAAVPARRIARVRGLPTPHPGPPPQGGREICAASAAPTPLGPSRGQALASREREKGFPPQPRAARVPAYPPAVAERESLFAPAARARRRLRTLPQSVMLAKPARVSRKDGGMPVASHPTAAQTIADLGLERPGFQ